MFNQYLLQWSMLMQTFGKKLKVNVQRPRRFLCLYASVDSIDATKNASFGFSIAAEQITTSTIGTSNTTTHPKEVLHDELNYCAEAVYTF